MNRRACRTLLAKRALKTAVSNLLSRGAKTIWTCGVMFLTGSFSRLTVSVRLGLNILVGRSLSLKPGTREKDEALVLSFSRPEPVPMACSEPSVEARYCGGISMAD
jgi:hypothetical protein